MTSLKCKIKKLNHKGLIDDKDTQRIINTIDREKLLEKALDKACEAIANYCEKSDTGCKYCPFSGCNGLGCEKDIHLSLDDTFDCDMPEWWREALLKEVCENGTND